MQVESGTMPQSFKIEIVDGEAFVTFAENVQEVAIEESVKYTYDSYTLKTKNSPTLEQRIAEKYDLWLKMAKAEEAKPSAEQIAQADQTLKVVDILMEVGLL